MPNATIKTEILRHYFSDIPQSRWGAMSEQVHFRDDIIRILRRVAGEVTGYTAGSVIFAGSDGTLAEDNANFFYLDSANQLFLGGTTAALADTILGADGSAVFNEQGSDVDHRVEGDTATQLFVCDAGLDAVQIGTTTAGVIADFRSSAIVFNEEGADRDFRVESDTDANQLFVDASTNRIGFGTGAPGAKVDVAGTATGVITLRVTAASGQTSSIVRFQDFGGTASLAMDVDAGVLLRNTVASEYALLDIWNNLNVGPKLYSYGSTAGTSTGASPLGVLADDVAVLYSDNALGLFMFTNNNAPVLIGSSNIERMRFNGTVSIVVNEPGNDIDLRVEGDTATNLLVCDAGLDAVQIGTTTAGVIADFRSATIVFNEDGADRDVRIEGDTDANNFFIDASTNRVGVGTAVPGGKLSVTGTADEIQLRVLANATQTTNAQTWENSAGTVQALVTGDGRMAIARSTVAGSTAGLSLGKYFDMRFDPGGSYLDFVCKNENAGAAGLGGIRWTFQPQNAATQQEVIAEDGELKLLTGGIPGSTSAVKALAIDANKRVYIDGFGASTTGLYLESASAQSADPFQLANNSSIVQIRFTATGGAVFNDNGEDTDVRVEGDTATQLFVCDAGLDAVQIGTTTAGVIADFRSAAIVFNEDGSDRDFRVEGDTLPYMIFTDATSTSENIALLTTAAPAWQAMNGGMFLGNATTAPTGNPTAGGFLYATGGTGTWRGSSGTVTSFGPSGPHCGRCGADFWRTCYVNEKWGAELRECGWCGKVYRKGPKTFFRFLTEQEQSELLV